MTASKKKHQLWVCLEELRSIEIRNGKGHWPLPSCWVMWAEKKREVAREHALAVQVANAHNLDGIASSPHAIVATLAGIAIVKTISHFFTCLQHAPHMSHVKILGGAAESERTANYYQAIKYEL